mgnify:CR=1 FL=1
MKKLISKDHRSIILGGAQLGLKYGMLPKKISIKNIESIIETALKYNINSIDTAYNYGDSEKNIGNLINKYNNSQIRIISKLKVFKKFYSTLNLKKEVIESIQSTLNNLEIKFIDTLLIHEMSNMNINNGFIWKYLISIKNKKIFKNLGVSIQNKKELLIALSIKDVSVIQLPFNIIDNRWDDVINQIIKTKKKRNLEIHVRSVFLQGLLLNFNNKTWNKTKFKNYKFINTWLNDKTKLFKRKSVVDLCLSYVKSQDWIDKIIMGVDSKDHLINNIELFNLKSLSLSEINDINLSRPKVNNTLLNPSKWRK